MKPRIRWVYVIQRDELEILGIEFGADVMGREKNGGAL